MVRFGTVRFFNSREGKSFGFIEADDEKGGPQIFFHVVDYCDSRNRAAWLDREPRVGDRVAFRISKDWNKKPKASPWTYESEYRPSIKDGEPLRIHLHHLPLIEHWELESDDISVGSFDVDGDWGRGPRRTWIEVILRTRTGELFQLRCWEGEYGGETTPDRAFRHVPGLEIRFPKSIRKAERRELVDRAA